MGIKYFLFISHWISFWISYLNSDLCAYGDDNTDFCTNSARDKTYFRTTEARYRLLMLKTRLYTYNARILSPLLPTVVEGVDGEGSGTSYSYTSKAE